MPLQRMLGPRVKELIAVHGWSPQEFANKAGLSTDQVMSIINHDANKPSQERAKKVARALQTTIGYLAGDTDDAGKVRDQLAAFRVNKQGEDAQAQVAEIIQQARAIEEATSYEAPVTSPLTASLPTHPVPDAPTLGERLRLLRGKGGGFAIFQQDGVNPKDVNAWHPVYRTVYTKPETAYRHLDALAKRKGWTCEEEPNADPTDDPPATPVTTQARCPECNLPGCPRCGQCFGPDCDSATCQCGEVARLELWLEQLRANQRELFTRLRTADALLIVLADFCLRAGRAIDLMEGTPEYRREIETQGNALLAAFQQYQERYAPRTAGRSFDGTATESDGESPAEPVSD